MWHEQIQPKYISKTKRSLIWLTDALLTRQGSAAYLPIIIVTICMFCGASWLIFWPTSDAAHYQCYALTFWLGSSEANKLLPATQCGFLPPLIHTTAAQAAFHILPVEYPPLTLIPFSLALLAPLPYYQLAFALLMSLTAVLIYWLLLHYGPRGSTLVFAFYLFTGALATAQGRFDLLPAFCTLLCVIAAERKHWTAAYIALAFGVLFKLYPLLLLPALFIAEQRARKLFYTPPAFSSLSSVPQQLWYTLRGVRQWYWKNCFLSLAIILSVTAFFAFFNLQGAIISQFSYFIGRPVQIEATGSTFLWLAQMIGIPFQIKPSFGSINIISELGGLVSSISTLFFIVGCIYITWLQWLRKLDITQTAIALLLIFVVTGKVFSPQYLIWLIPLLAYAGAFDTFWLLVWGLISLLTSLIYIYFYTLHYSEPSLIPYTPGFFEAVSLRNALLVLATLAYIFNWFQARQRKSAPVRLKPKDTIKSV